MLNLDKNKETEFARRVLQTIRMFDEPKLCYKEEKDVVERALYHYIRYLESHANDIGNR